MEKCPHMYARKSSGEMPPPNERARDYAEVLWLGEGSSTVAIAKREKISHLRLGWAAELLGFRVGSAVEGRKRGLYSHGPCMECWKVRERRNIDASSGHRCKSCVAYEKVRNSLPVDVRKERSLYDARIANDPSRLEGLQKRNPFLKRYTKGG